MKAKSIKPSSKFKKPILKQNWRAPGVQKPKFKTTQFTKRPSFKIQHKG